MKEKRYLDAQGRVILPNHIRKALNLKKGSLVTVTLNDDGTINIKPEAKRCHICGANISDEDHSLKIGSSLDPKFVCNGCVNKIKEETAEW